MNRQTAHHVRGHSKSSTFRLSKLIWIIDSAEIWSTDDMMGAAWQGQRQTVIHNSCQLVCDWSSLTGQSMSITHWDATAPSLTRGSMRAVTRDWREWITNLLLGWTTSCAETDIVLLLIRIDHIPSRVGWRIIECCFMATKCGVAWIMFGRQRVWCEKRHTRCPSCYE